MSISKGLEGLFIIATNFTLTTSVESVIGQSEASSTVNAKSSTSIKQFPLLTTPHHLALRVCASASKRNTCLVSLELPLLAKDSYPRAALDEYEPIKLSHTRGDRHELSSSCYYTYVGAQASSVAFPFRRESINIRGKNRVVLRTEKSSNWATLPFEACDYQEEDYQESHEALSNQLVKLHELSANTLFTHIKPQLLQIIAHLLNLSELFQWLQSIA